MEELFKRDPVTLDLIRPNNCFVLIDPESRKEFFYDAGSLYRFFVSSSDLRCPITRRPLNQIELNRLCRIAKQPRLEIEEESIKRKERLELESVVDYLESRLTNIIIAAIEVFSTERDLGPRVTTLLLTYIIQDKCYELIFNLFQIGDQTLQNSVDNVFSSIENFDLAENSDSERLDNIKLQTRLAIINQVNIVRTPPPPPPPDDPPPPPPPLNLPPPNPPPLPNQSPSPSPSP